MLPTPLRHHVGHPAPLPCSPPRSATMLLTQLHYHAAHPAPLPCCSPRLTQLRCHVGQLPAARNGVDLGGGKTFARARAPPPWRSQVERKLLHANGRKEGGGITFAREWVEQVCKIASRGVVPKLEPLSDPKLGDNERSRTVNTSFYRYKTLKYE